MSSLKVLRIPQNGIKEAGMTELLNSLSGQQLEVVVMILHRHLISVITGSKDKQWEHCAEL